MVKIRNYVFFAFIVGAFSLFITSCPKDDNGDTHTHKWEWVVTQEGNATVDRIETETCSCGATNGTSAIPIAREKIITVTVSENTTATVKGTLTLADINTLSVKLTTAIEAGFNLDLGDDWDNEDKETWFNIVFNGGDHKKATIIIESNVNYTFYEADDRITLRLNIDYLLTATADDLRDKIISAITEMRVKLAS
jgi:hypothetical protein